VSKHIIFLGSRGYTKNYGGWETFIKNLIDNWKDKDTKFYVIELVRKKSEEETVVINGVTCIRLCVSKKGNTEMVLLDFKALLYLIKFIKKNKLNNPILYVLGPKVAALFLILRPYLKRLGVTLLHNPAGLEWTRSKWNYWTKKYIYYSHIIQAKVSDYLICDSREMVKVYKRLIKKNPPKMVFIPYGTYNAPPLDSSMPQKVKAFFNLHGMTPGSYYLMLGRFVPENNYELVIREFMKSNTKRDLIIICNVEKNKFFQTLNDQTGFSRDSRIKFIGTTYDKEILNYVRQNAKAYIHGHSVGGTNPGLLEAMAATDVNILYDVVFNREVGSDAAFYFTNVDNSLANLIESCDSMTQVEKFELGKKSKQRMEEYYTWDNIVEEYKGLFNNILND
jgi:rhamnosyltransferase